MSDHWPLVPLNDVLIRSDEAIELKPEQNYKQVTVRLWGKGVVLRREITGADIAATRQYVVHANQFILSRIDARNGAFGLVPEVLDGAIVSNDFPVFSIRQDQLLPTYLAWLTRTRGFIELCKAASEGTTNRVRLKEDRFLSTSISLPLLCEQRRIVARIEELAGKIEEARGLREQSADEAQRMLMSVYAGVVEGSRRLPMAEVAPLVRRPVNVSLTNTYDELGIRSFGKGTFHKPAINGVSLGTKRIFRIEPGDLVFNIVFAWEGAVAVAKPEDKGRVGSHRFLTCVPKTGLATSPFLRFHFLTDRGLESLGLASPGGAGRNRTLSIKGLESILVPIPPFDRQLWFDQLQARVDEMRGLQAAADAERDAMLPSILDKAFKGKL